MHKLVIHSTIVIVNKYFNHNSSFFVGDMSFRLRIESRRKVSGGGNSSWKAAESKENGKATGKGNIAKQ